MGGTTLPPPAASMPAASPVVSRREGKGKRGLWIGGGAAAVVLLLLGGLALALTKSSNTENAATASAEGAGSLTVNVTPADATLIVDGNPVPGTSPFIVSKLAAGPHKVVVTKAGFATFEKQIDIQAGAPLLLPVTLAPARIELTLDVQPKEATVALVEGDTTRPLGKAGEKVTVDPKPGVAYMLEVSAPGYETKRVPLSVGEGVAQTITVALSEKAGKAPARDSEPAKVAAATGSSSTKRSRGRRRRSTPRPAGQGMLGVATAPGTPPATVFIDGRKVGKTPRPPKKVSAGGHTVKCSWKDGKSFSERVSVPKDGRAIVRCKKG